MNTRIGEIKIMNMIVHEKNKGWNTTRFTKSPRAVCTIHNNVEYYGHKIEVKASSIIKKASQFKIKKLESTLTNLKINVNSIY